LISCNSRAGVGGRRPGPDPHDLPWGPINVPLGGSISELRESPSISQGMAPTIQCSAAGVIAVQRGASSRIIAPTPIGVAAERPMRRPRRGQKFGPVRRTRSRHASTNSDQLAGRQRANFRLPVDVT